MNTDFYTACTAVMLTVVSLLFVYFTYRFIEAIKMYKAIKRVGYIKITIDNKSNRDLLFPEIFDFSGRYKYGKFLSASTDVVYKKVIRCLKYSFKSFSCGHVQISTYGEKCSPILLEPIYYWQHGHNYKWSELYPQKEYGNNHISHILLPTGYFMKINVGTSFRLKKLPPGCSIVFKFFIS